MCHFAALVPMTVVGAIGPPHLACGMRFPSWLGTSLEWKVGRLPKFSWKVQASELGNIFFGNPIFLTKFWMLLLKLIILYFI